MKGYKKLLAVILFAALVCIMSVTSFGASALTGKSAMEIVAMMGPGWNLGNTFDANGKSSASDVYAHEKYWGNPQVTETLIAGVKSLGFNTIRIPVTWYTELSGDNYYINRTFLARVKEVVDMAISRDMFVILNVHHETWVNSANLGTNYVNIGNELAAVWTQLANEFGNYDQHLIFEGMNEPRAVGTNHEWSGTPEEYAAINYLDQVFVSTIRKSSYAKNKERCLMVPQYAASSQSSILSQFEMPQINGEDAENIILSVHCYSPYNFCLSDAQSTFDVSSTADTGEVTTLFTFLDKNFISKGVPVVIGESSATNTNNNTDARAAWAGFMGKMSGSYGIPVVLWDNGADRVSDRGECHAHVNRYTGAANYPAVTSAFVNGFNAQNFGSARKEYGTETSLAGGTVIWQETAGVNAGGWTSDVKVDSLASYYSSGADFMVVYTGSQAPKLVLDSATYQKWWMQIDSYKTATVNGKRVAYYKKSTIDSVLSSNGIASYAGLRNIMIVPTVTSTIYELSLDITPQPTTYKVTFDANGGSNATASMTKEKGKALTISLTDAQIPVKNGYFCVGFAESKDAKDPDYTIIYPFTYNRDKSVTLYAVWQKNPFADCIPLKWYKRYIGYVLYRGIMTGYEPDTAGITNFGHSDNLLRAEMMTLLYKLEGKPAAGNTVSAFPDVPVKKWYTGPINWGKANGVTTGRSDGTFAPLEQISRQDFVVMLFRYARVKGLGTAVSSSIAYQEKADWKKVSGYAVTAVNWGYSNGFIGNGSDLKPQDNITRAEAATIMARFVVKYGI